MTKRMLIDAVHPEETRVVITDERSTIHEFDFTSSAKAQIKGNIYLAKVTRVEPSLQAAFVEYGGGKQGFLPFSEIHPDYYQIPVDDRKRLIEEEIYGSDDEEEEEAPRERNDRGERGDRNDRGGRGRRRRGNRAARNDRPQDSVSEAINADDTLIDEALAGNAGSDELQAEDLSLDALPFDAITEADEGNDFGDSIERSIEDFSANQPLNFDSDQDDNQRFNEEGHDGFEPALDEGREQAEHTAPEDAALAEAGFETHASNEEASSEEASSGQREEPRSHSDAQPEGDEEVETLSGEDEIDRPRRKPNYSRRYKIQEVIKRNQILLVQVIKEERGNKGVSLTSFISLAGRYCVLMPNSPRGGGVSRKIGSGEDRKQLKQMIAELTLPQGMSVIIRTAGSQRTRAEIKRDFDYLVKLWNQIREDTLASSAPALIYEESDLIKRTIRDSYSPDIEEILVQGEEAFKDAKTFMRLLIPSHAPRVKLYKQDAPLFHQYRIEDQLQAMQEPVVKLKSGGYIVINPTEALISIDVNSGRSTGERNIEETAVKTNAEAAHAIARQLRLRDLAGLIVIDFIDMMEGRNRRHIEKTMKEALKSDRAKIQLGRISAFGLMEMSRQRLRPSISETVTRPCPHCEGTGLVRSDATVAIQIIRSLEKETSQYDVPEFRLSVTPSVAAHLLNSMRGELDNIEQSRNCSIKVSIDTQLTPGNFRLEKVGGKAVRAERPSRPPRLVVDEAEETASDNAPRDFVEESEEEGNRRRRRGGRNRNRNRSRDDQPLVEGETRESTAPEGEAHPLAEGEEESGEPRRRRRRGGRNRNRNRNGESTGENINENTGEDNSAAPGDQSTLADASQPADKAVGSPKPSLADVAAVEKPARRRIVRPKASEAMTAMPVESAALEPAAKPARARAPRASKSVAEAAPAVAAEEPAPVKKEPARKGWWQKMME